MTLTPDTANKLDALMQRIDGIAADLEDWSAKRRTGRGYANRAARRLADTVDEVDELLGLGSRS